MSRSGKTCCEHRRLHACKIPPHKYAKKKCSMSTRSASLHLLALLWKTGWLLDCCMLVFIQKGVRRACQSRSSESGRCIGMRDIIITIPWKVSPPTVMHIASAPAAPRCAAPRA